MKKALLMSLGVNDTGGDRISEYKRKGIHTKL